MRCLMKSENKESETILHPSLSETKTAAMNNSLNILTAYIKRHGNPYNINVSCQKLKKIATQVMVDPVVAEPLLNFFPNAKQIFDEYHRQVYIAKTSLLHGKIKKLKLPKFNAIVHIDLREQNIPRGKKKEMHSSHYLFI